MPRQESEYGETWTLCKDCGQPDSHAKYCVHFDGDQEQECAYCEEFSSDTCDGCDMPLCEAHAKYSNIHSLIFCEACNEYRHGVAHMTRTEAIRSLAMGWL